MSIEFWRLILYVESIAHLTIGDIFRYKMVCQMGCDVMEFVLICAFTIYNFP